MSGDTQDLVDGEYGYVDLEDDEITAILDLAELLAEQGSELWKGIYKKLNEIYEGE